MNLYVYNCPNTFNYGSMMMAENFISYFSKINKEARFHVETEDSVNIDRLKHATAVPEIYRAETNSLFSQKPGLLLCFRSFFGRKKSLSAFGETIDLVVVLGGDDFTEDYGWEGPLLSGVLFNCLVRNGVKVVMLGQTMGPFYSFRIPAMKYLLGKIHRIYPRDSLTYDYLKRLGLRNCFLTDELALLPLARQEKRERTKEYITYCPSELIYRYSKEGSREQWVEFNRFLVETLLNRYPDKKLVLLAHVLRPAHADDRILVDELYAMLGNRYEDRILVVRDEIFPYEVRNYIQQSLFVVSGRMHPVISSIQCEIPAIALSYSEKYWGIIGKRAGLGEYIIDIRYLDYSQMRDRFRYLLDKIEVDYEHIQEIMHCISCDANRTVLRTLDEIGGMLK